MDYKLVRTGGYFQHMTLVLHSSHILGYSPHFEFYSNPKPGPSDGCSCLEEYPVNKAHPLEIESIKIMNPLSSDHPQCQHTYLKPDSPANS